MPRKRKMNIPLVISDDLLRKTILDMLTKYCHSAVAFGTGAEAILFLPLLNVDLLIVGLNVEPEGAEPIVRAFRVKHERLPVLLVAGSYSNRDLTRVRKMQAACWCTGDFHDFWTALRKACALAPS